MTRVLQKLPWLVFCATACLSALLPVSAPPARDPVTADERKAEVDAALDGPKLILHSLRGVELCTAGDGGGIFLEVGSVAVGSRHHSIGAPPTMRARVFRHPSGKKKKGRDPFGLSSLMGESEEEGEDDIYADAFGAGLEVDLPTHDAGWGWLVDEVVGPRRQSRVDRAMRGDILRRDNYRNFMRRDPLDTTMPSADDALSYDGGLGP